MYSAELALLVAIVVGTTYSQDGLEDGCISPTTSDLKSVISAILAPSDSGSSLQITLSNFNVVCRAFAQREGLLRFVSVVVEYTCIGHPNCPSQSVVEQIESGCDSGSWSNTVVGSSDPSEIVSAPNGTTLSTTAREDCSFCLSPQLAAIQGPTTDPVTHCVACDSNCNEGSMRCYGFGSGDCCPFYYDGMCLDECPDTLVADDKFVCSWPISPPDHNVCGLQCENGGTPAETNCTECLCPPGYTGQLCDGDIDECEDTPCANGATCMNTNGSFTCMCPPGYTGQLCDEDIDECDTMLCANGVTCINTNGSFTCVQVNGLNGETYYEVKEGESVTLTCTPLPETVTLDWELPHTSTVVQYQEPLRHTLTIHGANINHNGNYTCSVVGDETSSFTAYVRVLERCLADLSGGLFWSTAFDGDTVSRPCRDVDESFSQVVKVYRTCSSNRTWTSVDFSGCVLSFSEQKVLVILSLRANFTGGRPSNISLEEQLRQAAQTSGGSAPLTSSLTILPQTLSSQTLLVWKVSYTTAELALAGQLESIACRLYELTINSTEVVIQRRPDIVAIMRSDFCECRQVQLSGNNEGEQECPTIDIQELCNGTVAGPCDCQPFQQCQCTSPYVGDGSLCVLDSDRDGYPDRALRTCSSDDQLMYCNADTCPFAPNLDQSDTSICVGDETYCPEEVDQVWIILWPSTPPGVTATISCGVNFVGNATRLCQSDMMWAEPNVINCQSRVFVDITERADEALESEDTETVLRIVGELVDATANEETPQLPQDLNTTIGIITATLDLLFTDLSSAARQNMIAADLQTAVVFEVLDNILSESNQASYDSLQEVGVASQAVLKNAESFGLFATQVLANNEDMGPCEVVNITGKSIALRVQCVSVDDKAQYSFPSPQEIKNLALPNSTLANISLSSSFLVEGAAGQQSKPVVVASILFETLQMFLPPSSLKSVQGEPASLIISSQLAVDEGRVTTHSQSEEGEVVIEFQFPSVPIRETEEKRVSKCVFWDFGNGFNSLAESGWSVENVTTEKVTVSGGQSTVRCSSSHLTSFAVLVDVRGVRVHSRALSFVSYIGLTISIICLTFTIIFFISLRKKLFTAVNNFIHLNLAISLLAAYLVFAVGVDLASSNEIGCKAVTALVQYFFLAAFSWMLCEGVVLYLKLVRVFTKPENKWWLFLLFGWGIPLPLVAIGLGALHEEYGVKDITGNFQYCWLSYGDGMYAMWTLFVAPMLLIILVNVVFLALVLRVIYKTKNHQQSINKSITREKMGSNLAVVKSTVKATVILLPLLGMTWVFGLLAVNEKTAVFAWIFTILNSLQGFFIFVFHVLRDQTVSTTIRKKFLLCFSIIYKKFGGPLRSLRSGISSTSPRLSALKIYGDKTSGFVSGTENTFTDESSIIQRPKLPVTFEGKDIKLQLFNPDDQEKKNESVFGPVVVKTIIKVNPGTTHND